MDGTAQRIAVGGLVGVVALCVLGMAAVSTWGRDPGAALIALAGLAATSLGILGTLLQPTGKLPTNGPVPMPGPPTVPFQPPHTN